MTSRKKGARSNWNCPSCNSSDVYCEGGKVFECRDCGERIHEGVLEASAALTNLSDRNDKVGELASRLLETGGVVSE